MKNRLEEKAKEEEELISERQITDNIDILMDVLQNADKEIFGYITSGHGRLSKPRDGKTHDTLPNNMKLILLSSRGSFAFNGFGADNERTSIKFLIELQKGVKSNKPFFDGDGCLTDKGEELLANMGIAMMMKKTYKEYYGVNYGEPIPRDKVPWFAIELPQFEEVRAKGWSSQFFMLKEYDDTYNEQEFMFGDMNDVNRFGILFMYTDKRDQKNKIIFLSLKPLLLSLLLQEADITPEELDSYFRGEVDSYFSGEEEFRFYMKMSQLFEHIQSLSTDERTKDLKFYFTHRSCRIVEDEEVDALTREFSNRKEKDTIKCFIKKFPEDKREVLINFFDVMKDGGIITIYDFYKLLHDYKIYDIWLEELRKGGQGCDKLFDIIDFLTSFDPQHSDKMRELLREHLTKPAPVQPEPEPGKPEPEPETGQPEPEPDESHDFFGGGNRNKKKKSKRKKSKKRKSKRKKSKRRKSRRC